MGGGVIMRKSLFCCATAVLVASCSWFERIKPQPVYDWTVDRESIEVFEDVDVTLNVLGSNVPEQIEWRCEPENFVRYLVSDGGKKCLVQRRGDGECLLFARSGDMERSVKVKVGRYSRSGLHLRVNGEDMYFPLINPNYPTYSDYNRYFTVHLNKKDTVKVEVVEWLPKELEKVLMVRSVSSYSNLFYRGGGGCFLFNYPYNEVLPSGEIYYRGGSEPFEKIKGCVIKNWVWAHDETPWRETEGEYVWCEDYEEVPSFCLYFVGGFGKDKWGDNIGVTFSVSFLLREDESCGIVDFNPNYI